MKKIIALTLALLMLTMSFVACNEGTADVTTEAENNSTEAPVETTVEATEAVVELPYKSAIELLQIIFDGYNAAQATDDTKLWVGGGNIYNFDTVNPEGPAAFVALADTDYDENLAVPTTEVAKIASAASMFNLMNTNNFNCYTIQFNAGTDVDASIEAIKAQVLARRWICGAPEKLVIVKMPGDCILVVWGAVNYGGIVDPFAASIPTLVEGATIVVEHTFAE
jgi:hypothetical protein